MDALTPAQRYYQKHKDARKAYGRAYYQKQKEKKQTCPPTLVITEEIKPVYRVQLLDDPNGYLVSFS